MIDNNLYQKYVDNFCDDVWNVLNQVDYNQLDKEQKEIVNLILDEAIKRIDFNIKLIFSLLEKNGFKYINYGDLNSFNCQYALKKEKDFQFDINVVVTNTNKKFPLLFTKFVNFFNVVDFRGDFTFNVDFLLDSLFIESFDSLSSLSYLTFELDRDGELVDGLMFSPDQFVKENQSGDIGVCIELSEDLLVDNFVLNLSDSLLFTFREYLQFSFEWACCLNLYWSTKDEQEDFNSIITEVREKLLQF